MKLFRTTDVIVFLALWILAFSYGPRTGYWITGLCVATISFGLFMTARVQLGRSFMISARANELVTSGLYRYFSHPIYLFGAVAHAGVFLAFQQPWLMAIWFAYATPIQWLRLRKENQLLEAAFGDAFRNHRAKTWI